MEERGKVVFQVQEEDAKKEDAVVTFDRVAAEAVVADTASEEKTGILAKFGGFWRKSKKNKIAVILGGVLILALIGGVLSSLTPEEEESYSWPDNDMAQMLPKPEGKITDVSTMSGEYLYATVKMPKKKYMSYVEKCKEKGFGNVTKEDQSSGWYEFEATNEGGYALSLDYDEDESKLDISLKLPEEEQEESSEETTSTESSSGGPVSADFKATMDSYEKFMNSYVDFMKKYEKSNDVSSMMSDYAEFTSKYADFAKKIEAIDENNLSSADYAYYAEVNARVTKKLAELTS